MQIERMRIDKWLWAARFFKTRSLATQAVEGGRIRVNGDRAKASKEIRIGDRLILHIAELEWQLTVVGLSMQRGPAPVARQLYEETPESAAARAEAVAVRKVERDPAADRHGRPTKRDRRLIHRFNT